MTKINLKFKTKKKQNVKKNDKILKTRIYEFKNADGKNNPQEFKIANEMTLKKLKKLKRKGKINNNTQIQILYLTQNGIHIVSKFFDGSLTNIYYPGKMEGDNNFGYGEFIITNFISKIYINYF